MNIDYRTLLDRAVTFSVYDNDEVGLAILATRITDLCPDCDQGDVKHLPYSQTCTHPNAPTIADLLRWGENVAKADQLGYGEVGVVGYGVTDSAAVLLAALRTEADRG